MKLSPAQVQHFWREWSVACAIMHWTRADGLAAAEIDAHRKEFLARCGCLESRGGCKSSRVNAGFKSLQGIVFLNIFPGACLNFQNE
jgi:hypothetical protein